MTWLWLLLAFPILWTLIGWHMGAQPCSCRPLRPDELPSFSYEVCDPAWCKRVAQIAAWHQAHARPWGQG